MARLTRRRSSGEGYIVAESAVSHEADGYSGEAIRRLAMFENVYEALVARQSQIAKELDRLRQADKQKSVRFRELLANKLMNEQIFTLFAGQGLQQQDEQGPTDE